MVEKPEDDPTLPKLGPAGQTVTIAVPKSQLDEDGRIPPVLYSRIMLEMKQYTDPCGSYIIGSYERLTCMDVKLLEDPYFYVKLDQRIAGLEAANAEMRRLRSKAQMVQKKRGKLDNAAGAADDFAFGMVFIAFIYPPAAPLATVAGGVATGLNVANTASTCYDVGWESRTCVDSMVDTWVSHNIPMPDLDPLPPPPRSSGTPRMSQPFGPDGYPAMGMEPLQTPENCALMEQAGWAPFPCGQQ
jgi:hypothetical protein